MKNPIFFTNKRDQVVFIYRIYDNSLFQLAILKENETTVLNIPHDSHIMVKRGKLIGEFMVPIETIIENHHMRKQEPNYYHL